MLTSWTTLSMSFLKRLINVAIHTSCAAGDEECQRIGNIIKATILMFLHGVLSIYWVDNWRRFYV